MAFLIVWNEFLRVWSTVLCNASQPVAIKKDDLTIKSVGHNEPKRAILEVIEESLKVSSFFNHAECKQDFLNSSSSNCLCPFQTKPLTSDFSFYCLSRTAVHHANTVALSASLQPVHLTREALFFAEHPLMLCQSLNLNSSSEGISNASLKRLITL